MTAAPTPIRVALVNDYEVVLQGLRQMLLPHADRISVVELDVHNRNVSVPVDIALYDAFGRDATVLAQMGKVLADADVHRAVLYTWAVNEDFVGRALRAGASGVLSKTLEADDLVVALERIHAGEQVISSPTSASADAAPANVHRSGDWPGSTAGLTQREAEMVALITAGLTNADIAARTYLSPNSVKSYIRSAYKKIGVVRRSQAVAWGIEHGMNNHHKRTIITHDLATH